MILFSILQIVTVLCVVIAALAFVLSIACDEPIGLLAASIVIIIAIASGCGATAIEEKNTTIESTIISMEVTKCDLTSLESTGGIKQQYYITVGEYLVGVSEEEYAAINVGDIVSVEIITKTVFGEKHKPIVSINNFSNCTAKV